MQVSQSKAAQKFLETVAQSNESTANTYKQYIMAFDEFCLAKYGMLSDGVIERINKGTKPDAYDILSSFMAYVKNEHKVSVNTLRFFVKTARNFLEFHDVAINKVQFKLKVRLPRRMLKQKQAIDKEDVREILNGCSDIRTKSYLMFLAATGARATEALSIRLKDLELESNPARVNFRAEFTKTRQDRYVFLTNELKEQLKVWLQHKYRTYRSCYYDKKGKSVSEQINPVKRHTDLVFAVYHKDGSNPKLLHLYQDFRDAMQVALKNAGLLEYEDGPAKRMKITLHSFRRFVKTTISALGQVEFSEYMLGHAGSPYFRMKDQDKIEMFVKMEQYLTFLDYSDLEAKGADFQSQLEQERDRNNTLQKQFTDYRMENDRRWEIIMMSMQKHPERFTGFKPEELRGGRIEKQVS
ncbi:MAG TPA: tyrosine-type recombinase/integrase [Nitrososphaera sp.]|jgi:integrase|nr:tyrosine-type recombinase/integrase [Nitrososphaera sp.]